jgi:hypothetical protein
MACNPPTVVIGGVTISTSDFVNAREIVTKVSGDTGDPTLDEYEENIANGNNTRATTGIQFPAPVQTTLPEPIKEKAKETDEVPPPNNQGTPVGCSPWTGNYGMQLSPHFTVKDFTVGAVFPYPMQDYPGFPANVRVCNLQSLAMNICEPMYAKFGKFSINSGIRNATSSKTNISQHVKGEAVDIQFPGWSYSRYWDNAEWIKNNIPYDQFIFEHSTTTGLAWYHLSFKRTGNRPANDRTKVMTMYKNNYSPGLKRYG